MPQQHSCSFCGKTPLSKNEIGITKKLYGAKPKNFFCIDCLARHLEISTQDILDTIEDYKAEGCKMFE